MSVVSMQAKKATSALKALKLNEEEFYQLSPNEAMAALWGGDNVLCASDVNLKDEDLTPEELEFVNSGGLIPLPIEGELKVKERQLPSKKLSEAFKAAEPPSYLVQDFLQRGRLVCCTAPKGNHKTDLAILLAFAVAGGNAISDKHPVRRKGTVLFMAGENPEDVIDRMRALADKEGYSDRILNRIEFFPGAFDTQKAVDAFVKTYSGWSFDLVIFDTAQAYGPREDTNSNNQMLAFAHALRKLRAMGNPSVMVMAHPTKAAAKHNDNEFEPYGGSAFGNEVDGLCSMHREPNGNIRLSQNAKWRGRPWKEMYFKPGVIDDCKLLRYTTEDDNGVVYIEQGTAPFLHPIVGEERQEGETSQYHTLTHNQKIVVDSVMQIMMATKVAPEKEELAYLVATKWEKGELKTKKQTAKKTIDALVRKGVLELRGVGYHVQPNFRRAEKSE